MAWRQSRDIYDCYKLGTRYRVVKNGHATSIYVTNTGVIKCCGVLSCLLLWYGAYPQPREPPTQSSVLGSACSFSYKSS